MPNWVRNTITTDVQGFPKILSALVNEKNEVDFNKVNPIHKDLIATSSGSGSYVDKKCLITMSFHTEQIKDQDEFLDKFFENFYDEHITQADFVNKVLEHLKDNTDIKNILNKYCNNDDYNVFICGYFNTRRYGYADWYSANRDLWGTKWNAHESYLFEQDCAITFETAWSMPYPIIKELSYIAPVFIAYADEDTGSNFGIYKFNNGEYYDVLEALKDQHQDILKDIPLDLVNYVVASAIFGSDNDAILCDMDSFYPNDEECMQYFDLKKAELTKHTENILDGFVVPYLDKYLIR